MNKKFDSLEDCKSRLNSCLLNINNFGQLGLRKRHANNAKRETKNDGRNHHHYHVGPPAQISLTLSRHFSLGLQGYIPYPHIAAVCMFELVVLLLPGHMWGSIGVQRNKTTKSRKNQEKNQNVRSTENLQILANI